MSSSKSTNKSSSTTSSKSMGSRPTTSAVRSAPPKPAPAPAPKPNNVDKVDFGKTKTTADAGVYHRPKPIAAATGRDPEPPRQRDMKPGVSYPAGTFIKREVVYQASPAEIAKVEKHKKEFNAKIEQRAKAQIEAEKKARTKTSTAVTNTFLDGCTTVLAASTGFLVGGPVGAAVGGALEFGAQKARATADAIAEDQGKMTFTEKISYDHTLYPRIDRGFLTTQAWEDKQFDKAHQDEIDKIKEELRNEEKKDE